MIHWGGGIVSSSVRCENEVDDVDQDDELPARVGRTSCLPVGSYED